MRSLSFLIAGILLSSGCGPGKGVVLVEVTSNPTITATSLAVQVMLNGVPSQPIDNLIPPAMLGATPFDFSLVFGPNHTGSLFVVVTALDDTGTPILSASGSATVTASKTVTMLIGLGTDNTTGDGGADLSGPPGPPGDMARPPTDMAMPPNVASLLLGTLGGRGFADGTGSAARFDLPQTAQFDGTKLWVTDPYAAEIRWVTPSGVVTTAPELTPYRGGTTPPKFSDAAVSADGTRVYVISTGMVTMISTSTGAYLGGITAAGFQGSTFQNVLVYGSAAPDGGGVLLSNASQWVRASADLSQAITVVSSGLNYVEGMAWDGASTIYGADEGAPGIVKATIASAGSTWTATTLTSAFIHPTGIAFDLGGTGLLYVVDPGDSTLRSVNPGTGMVTLVAGAANVGGEADNASGTQATFGFPKGIARIAANQLVIADTGNSKLRTFNSMTTAVGTLAGTSGRGFAASPAPLRFGHTGALATDPTGQMLAVADPDNNLVRVFTRSGTGGTTLTWSVDVGTPGVIGTTDGSLSTAKFTAVLALDMPDANTIIVGDGTLLRRIHLDTMLVETLAGTQNTTKAVAGTGSGASFAHEINGVAAASGTSVWITDGLYYGGGEVLEATISGTTATVSIAISNGASNFSCQTSGGPLANAVACAPGAIVSDHHGSIYYEDYFSGICPTIFVINTSFSSDSIFFPKNNSCPTPPTGGYEPSVALTRLSDGTLLRLQPDATAIDRIASTGASLTRLYSGSVGATQVGMPAALNRPQGMMAISGGVGTSEVVLSDESAILDLKLVK